MSWLRFMFALLASVFLTFAPAYAQSSTPATTSASLTPTSSSSGPTGSESSTATRTRSAGASTNPPDVLLHVPNLSVGRIELDVDDLRADINLAANVAGLVNINAGVALSIREVNLTITEVQAQLDLVVRLGHLVDIVNRVFESLDLNPLLITAVNNVTSILDKVVGEVDGLLGSITQGGNTLSFLVDNLGNIVQEVAGDGGPVSTIVGNYLTNMTFTGKTQELGGGLVQKTFSYSPLNALVNIVFNAAGQIVQAFVAKQNGEGGSTSSGNGASGPATATATA